MWNNYYVVVFMIEDTIDIESANIPWILHIYIDRVEKGEIEDARQIHILTLYSQSKNSLVQCFFCSVIAVRIICGIIAVRIICNIIAVRRNYELLVFQVVRLSITVQIRILSTGS